MNHLAFLVEIVHGFVFVFAAVHLNQLYLPKMGATYFSAIFWGDANSFFIPTYRRKGFRAFCSSQRIRKGRKRV